MLLDITIYDPSQFAQELSLLSPLCVTFALALSTDTPVKVPRKAVLILQNN
jgi:hypothetical protein